jgi:tetratricopeptide (TPR) repeat protein
MLPSRTLFPSLALLLLTIVVYIPVWRNDFIDLDDELYITANPQVTHGLTGEGFVWAFTTRHGNYWQPLSWLSLQLDAHLFSSHPLGGDVVLSPAAFHGQNLFWHAASVLLLFAVWQRLTGAPWCSFLVAGLFAVHPMHVESVAWAAERKDVLSTFFGLLTLWAYARYVEAPGWQRYVLLIAAFLACLLSKPMLFTLPLVLLLLDYWPLRRSKSSGRSLRSRLGLLVLEKVPLFLMAAAVAILTVVMRRNFGADVSLGVVSLSARLANAFAAYGWYLAHTIVPRDLCAFYPHPQDDWSASAVGAGVAVLIILTGLSAWQARRRPWLFVGWLWFVLTLLPVIGLMQGGMQAWADRFCYWPHIGLFVAAVWALAELTERLHLPARLSGAVAALALGGLAAATWIQVGYWRDTPTLWERVLAVTADHRVAHPNLGVYYLEKGQYDLAEAHLTEGLRFHPDGVDIHNALGMALLMLGREAEAAEHFRRALELVPSMSDAWCHLGLAWTRQGRSSEAIGCYRMALESDPGAADILAMLGQALWADGQRAEAIATLQAALDADPRQAHAWYGLGVAYLAQGRTDEAIEALTRALRFKPELVAAYSELAVALGRAGRWTDAVMSQATALRMQEDWEQHLAKMGGRVSTPGGIPPRVSYECRLAYALACCGDRLGAAETYGVATGHAPRWPEQFAARAWTLATDSEAGRRDPQTAYELASQAVDGAGDPSASLLDALAVAEAARGNFAEATATARRALDKAMAAGDSTLANAIRDRVNLYAEKRLVPASTGTCAVHAGEDEPRRSP